MGGQETECRILVKQTVIMIRGYMNDMNREDCD